MLHTGTTQEWTSGIKKRTGTTVTQPSTSEILSRSSSYTIATESSPLATTTPAATTGLVPLLWLYALNLMIYNPHVKNS